MMRQASTSSAQQAPNFVTLDGRTINLALVTHVKLFTPVHIDLGQRAEGMCIHFQGGERLYLLDAEADAWRAVFGHPFTPSAWKHNGQPALRGA